jgi:hypothetical protein
MVKHGLDILSEMMTDVKQDINNSSVLEVSHKTKMDRERKFP